LISYYLEMVIRSYNHVYDRIATYYVMENGAEKSVILCTLPPPSLRLLRECTCKYFVCTGDANAGFATSSSRRRTPSRVRAALEHRILTDVRAHYHGRREEEKLTPLQYVSVGSGGLLQDWVLLNAMHGDIGVSRIDAHCIDILYNPAIKNPGVRARMQAFEGSFQESKSVSVRFYASIAAFLSHTHTHTYTHALPRVDVLVAIDVAVSNSLEDFLRLAPNVLHIRERAATRGIREIKPKVSTGADRGEVSVPAEEKREEQEEAQGGAEKKHGSSRLAHGRMYVAEQVNPKEPVVCWSAALGGESEKEAIDVQMSPCATWVGGHESK
jgi:hypothetical protein